MKSLYESILSSTHSGKQKLINEKDLKEHGLELRPEEYGGMQGLWMHKKYKFTLRTVQPEKGIHAYVVDVQETDLKVHVKFIKTLKDLDLLLKWWESLITKKDSIKLLKQMEKLDEKW